MGQFDLTKIETGSSRARENEPRHERMAGVKRHARGYRCIVFLREFERNCGESQAREREEGEEKGDDEEDDEGGGGGDEGAGGCGWKERASTLAWDHITV